MSLKLPQLWSCYYSDIQSVCVDWGSQLATIMLLRKGYLQLIEIAIIVVMELGVVTLLCGRAKCIIVKACM